MPAKTQVKVAPLHSMLRLLAKLAGVFSDVVITRQDGKDYLYVANPSTQARVQVVMQKAGSFIDEGSAVSIAFAALDTALAKRSSPTLELTNSGELVITDGRLKIELSTSKYTSDTSISIPEGAVELELNTELSAFLNKTLPTLNIDKIHPAQPDFRLMAFFGNKCTILATYDAHQMCWTRSTEVFAGVRGSFNLPFSKFLEVVKNSPVANAKIYAAEDQLALKSSTMTLLAQTPPQEGLQGDASTIIIDKIKELTKFSGSTIEVDKEGLANFLHTSGAVAQEDSRIECVVGANGKNVEFTLSSNNGVCRAKMKLAVAAEPGTKVVFNTKMLQTILQKSPGTSVSISFNEQEVLVRGTACSYVTTALAL
jgi:hypothetical protein